MSNGRPFRRRIQRAQARAAGAPAVTLSVKRGRRAAAGDRRSRQRGGY